MSRPVRIGTRGSQLALWQANEVAKRLAENGYRPAVVPYKTTADKRQDVPLASIGGKGLWVKELEEALLRRDIDMAVHSLKDVPSIIPDEFVLAAFLERADPRDAWVNLESKPIALLPEGAVVGTSAPRRRAQLRALYPGLRINDIRGNVDTRINKLRAGLYDGAILASAGLTRLGRSSEITSYFSIAEMLPACGQGIVAIETLRDGDSRAIAASIDHPPTAQAAYCERGVLQKFGTLLDCYSACAVHATFDDGVITLRAFFGEIEGDRTVRVMCKRHDAGAVIDEVHSELVEHGVMELVS
ncbi:MAG TPA: hydroxymethylbilane synthase [Thermoanaerobaculia bacterium]|jgi:hydroxymethylbilane synthase|nr:hydroxymethylbilane synthase [Thermoanaerobaculia bacterium]